MVVPTQNHLRLKWGSVKAYDFKDQGCLDLVWSWQDQGSKVSAMAQHDTDEQKELLCKLCDRIEEIEGTIYLDWDGKYVSAKEAKEYIMDYDKK